MVDTAIPRAPEDVPLPADDELSPLEPAPLKPILQETVPAKPASLKPASLEPAPQEPAPAKAVPKESAPVKPTPPAPVPSKSALPESVPPPAHPSKEASAEDHGEAEDVVPPMNGKAAKGRATTKRREKSGVPALDRFLSEEDGGPDLDDDDWDFVEAGPDEERNGAKGNSLFARGVVDRYRLSVFRKGSTPQRITTRSVSGASNASTLASPDGATSPSPTTKPKRGRNPGLTFRRHPKEFLRAKSPASAGSSSTRLSAQTLHQSVSQALSTASSGGPLTPSPSVGASGASSAHGLRTKDSTLSVGTTPTVSSDQSADHSPPRDATVRSPGPDENGKNKKALKKGAEKVLALFSPQR
jgi:serum/glucocorticoid-regulated kinase 2